MNPTAPVKFDNFTVSRPLTTNTPLIHRSPIRCERYMSGWRAVDNRQSLSAVAILDRARSPMLSSTSTSADITCRY
jgi:hypothetical protein